MIKEEDNIILKTIDNYYYRTSVTSPNGLTNNVFNSCGLGKYCFPRTQIPSDGSDWPKVYHKVSQIPIWLSSPIYK